jgi:transposase
MSLEREQQLEAENAALKSQLAQLIERVAQLEAQLALNSRNSSKPPSTDAPSRPNRGSPAPTMWRVPH